MLDYKDVIIKHYVLEMSGSEIARHLNASKSGVNDFLSEYYEFPEPPNLLKKSHSIFYIEPLG